jgi:hypothetical protein
MMVHVPYIRSSWSCAANVSRNPTAEVTGLKKWEKKGKAFVVLPKVWMQSGYDDQGNRPGIPVVLWPFATDASRAPGAELWVAPTLGFVPTAVALLGISKQLTDIGYAMPIPKNATNRVAMINLIYVAFTRPIEQLYVVSREVGGKSSEAITLPAFLAEYVGTSLLPWKKEGTSYRLGEPVSATARQEKQDHPHPERMMVTAPWQDGYGYREGRLIPGQSGRLQITRPGATWYMLHCRK